MKQSNETIGPEGELPGAWAEDLCGRIEQRGRLFGYWYDAAQEAKGTPCWWIWARWGRGYAGILNAQREALEGFLDAKLQG